MKPMGVVGGIGPESTIDYYRATIAAYRERVAREPLLDATVIHAKAAVARALR